MELHDFFDPTIVYNQLFNNKTIGESVIFNDYDNIKYADVVILGLNNPKSENKISDDIREHLYNLYNHFNLIIYDLGNIKTGATNNDLKVVITEIFEYLNEKNIIVIGENNIFLQEIINIFSKKNVNLKITCVDSDLNIYPNYTFSKNCSYSNIGCQLYLNSSELIDKYLENKNEIYRLGEVRSNLESIEPCMRGSDIVRICAKSVRSADGPLEGVNMPNGFYADEICKLVRYAGISDKVSMFIYNPNSENLGSVTLELSAQILWHILDGISARQGDFPKSDIKLCNKYIVFVEEYDLEIVFYESKKTKRWWIEIDKNTVKTYIPCMKEDYDNACKNVLPNIYIREISKHF